MILDLFFPNRCLHCNRIIESGALVCNLCFENIQFFHYNNSKNNYLLERCNLLFPAGNAYALMEFQDKSLSREIVHQLKYKRREKVGKILAEWTLDRISFDSAKPDLLISVPLHPKKKRKRGYNQLHLFTETISKKLNIPYDHEIVKRNFYKKSQTFKDKAHRAEGNNMFSLTKKVENKNVLLIDDVYTTGNTMSHLAWEILKNPTNKINILVMAVDV